MHTKYISQKISPCMSWASLIQRHFQVRGVSRREGNPGLTSSH